MMTIDDDFEKEKQSWPHFSINSETSPFSLTIVKFLTVK